MGLFYSDGYVKFEKKAKKIVYFFSDMVTDNLIIVKKHTTKFKLPTEFFGCFRLAMIECAKKEDVLENEINTYLIYNEGFKLQFNYWLDMAFYKHDVIFFKSKPNVEQKEIIDEIYNIYSAEYNKSDLITRLNNGCRIEFDDNDLSKVTKLIEKLYDLL